MAFNVSRCAAKLPEGARRECAAAKTDELCGVPMLPVSHLLCAGQEQEQRNSDATRAGPGPLEVSFTFQPGNAPPVSLGG